MPNGAVASELAKEGKKNTTFFEDELFGFGMTMRIDPRNFSLP
jgi:hypothetical protein